MCWCYVCWKIRCAFAARQMQGATRTQLSKRNLCHVQCHVTYHIILTTINCIAVLCITNEIDMQEFHIFSIGIIYQPSNLRSFILAFEFFTYTHAQAHKPKLSLQMYAQTCTLTFSMRDKKCHRQN